MSIEINAPLKTHAAGRVELQVGKYNEAGEWIPRMKHIQDNAFTDYGYTLITNPTTQTPYFNALGVVLGEGRHAAHPQAGSNLADPKQYAACSRSGSVRQATLVGTDATTPIVSTDTFTVTIAPIGVNRNYTELGLGRNFSGQTIYAGTYISLVDASNNPVTLTVLADEYLQITYKTQLHIQWHLPAVPVTGTGVPAGTMAYLLHNEGSSSARVRTLHYPTAAYAASGWENLNLTEFTAQALNGNGSANNYQPGTGITWPLNTPPTLNTTTVNLVPPGTLPPGYIVGWGRTIPLVFAYSVLLSKGIPLTSTQELNIDVSVTFTPTYTNIAFVDDLSTLPAM